MISRADASLYRAKQQRNCVVAANCPSEFSAVDRAP